MRNRNRDTEVLSFIEEKMPGATLEERLQATHEFWMFFDALWAIADRLVREDDAVTMDGILPHL